jgi:uncharacterized phage protein gp47/JayE
MPFPRPTLTQLKDRVAADIATGLQGTSALLRYSNLGVLGKVFAKAVNGLYGYLDWIALQANPTTATGEYAIAWGALKGKFIEPAAAAGGIVTFNGNNGVTIPTGTPLVRNSDGATFTTVADVTITNGSASATVIAGTAGAIGNSTPGTSFSLGIGIAGVISSVVAITGLGGGADVETIDAFKARYLQAYAAPAQGGAEPDYLQWADVVPGVTRVWVLRHGMGPGTVVVYFMMDIVRASSGGFPQGVDGVAALEPRDIAASGDQLLVADAIYPVQPVTALVYAASPGRNAITLTIAGISGATSATKMAISAAAAAAIAASSSPGGVTLSDGSPGGVTYMSAIERAISAIPAAAGFVITAVASSDGAVSPGAAGNVTSNTGYLATLDAVTYI